MLYKSSQFILIWAVKAIVFGVRRLPLIVAWALLVLLEQLYSSISHLYKRLKGTLCCEESGFPGTFRDQNGYYFMSQAEANAWSYSDWQLEQDDFARRVASHDRQRHVQIPKPPSMAQGQLSRPMQAYSAGEQSMQHQGKHISRHLKLEEVEISHVILALTTSTSSMEQCVRRRVLRRARLGLRRSVRSGREIVRRRLFSWGRLPLELSFTI